MGKEVQAGSWGGMQARCDGMQRCSHEAGRQFPLVSGVAELQETPAATEFPPVHATKYEFQSPHASGPHCCQSPRAPIITLKSN